MATVRWRRKGFALLCCIWTLGSVDAAFETPPARPRWRPKSKWNILSSSPPRRYALRKTIRCWEGASNDESGVREKDEIDQKHRLVREAEELRERAKALRAEANAMEVTMRSSRTDASQRKTLESDTLIEQLFADNATTPVLVQRLDEDRWSPEQLSLIVDRLHERQVQASGRASASRGPDSFQIGDTRNSAESDQVEWSRLNSQIEALMAAASILDERSVEGAIPNKRWTGRVAFSLQSRLKEMRRVEEEAFQRRFAANVNAVANGSSGEGVQDYMQKSLGLSTLENESKASRAFNLSRVLDQVAMVPMWLPSSLLPFLLESRAKLESNDLTIIQNDVLKGTKFYCTSSDSIPAAAIFRGNIRTPMGMVNATKEANQTAVIFEEIQDKLTKAGLSQRIQLFFLDDPEWRLGRDQREPRPKPVILAIPKAVVPEQGTEGGIVSTTLAISSVGLTLFASFAFSVSCYALNPNFFESVINQQDISVLVACIPLFIGVLAVQCVHEAAHYVVSKRVGIKTGIPIPLPSMQLGTFGSITPLRSFPSSRSALLDFALSGPVAGMVTSIALLIGGIFATVYASSGALSHFPVVPVALLKSSYFIGSLLSVLAPKIVMLPSAQPIPIHPLFMIGFAGLISNALNMLPIGRLDGGRAYSAVFGSRLAVFASLAALTLMALLSLTGMSGLSLPWGLLIVLFQRRPEIPVRDEVTEVDDIRVGLYALSLALAIITLAPFPGGQGMT